MTGAETTAAFLLERVRAARVPLWDEGCARVAPPAPPTGPALQTFAERRVRGVPEDVVRGLFAWDRGERPVDLMFEVPAARRLLALQARGRRCVCLLEDALLPAERKMVELGDAGRVRDSRMAFQAATETAFRTAVEEILGRKVHSFASGVDANTSMVFENFYLQPRNGDGPDSGAA